MAGLDFCSKHNMFAYLEKNDGNTKFNQIIDFLTHSSIHFALTVSPIVLTLFVEQFWTSTKSRTVNNISYIDAIIAGKPMTISEASIRSDLLFDDPDLSPRPSSIPIPDSNPKGSGGNHGGQSSSDRSLSGNEDGPTLQSVYDLYVSLCIHVTAQAAEIKDLKAQIKQLKKKARPVINHHKAWFRAGAPFVQTNTDWDGLDTNLEATLNEAIDYTLTQDEGKTDSKVEEPNTISKTEELHLSGDTLVVEDKGSAKKGGSIKCTNLQQSTIKPDESTVKPDEGTDKQDEGTDRQVKGTAENKDQDSRESATPTAPTTTSPPTLIVFSNDETIAQVLVIMSQNKRPRPASTRSVLTLKPLPKIDPKAKGKGMIKEEDESATESEDITEAEKKFKMLANDEEMARKIQEEWEAEKEKERLNADKILAEKVQEEERENFTIEERAKLLHDTIAAQRRFLAQQRSEVIRNKLPSKTQLRNQMMTYLKHVGGKKHSDLKTKNFEEIQVLYEKVKWSDENFIAIGSVEDERLIKDLNKKVAGIKKADSFKEESKEEEGTKKRKLGTRKKMKSRKRRFRQDTSEGDKTNSKIENDELRLCLTIAPDEDKEYDETKDLEEINLNVVIRSNGQRRYFSTLMRVLSTFDKDDLCAVYQLMMDRYQDEIPEDFDKVLWGDLMIMFNPSNEDKFWNSQQDWNVVSWKLHGSSEVHTLMIEAGLVIHMLVEKKYPLRKKVLLQMLELKLESEEDSTMALELIRFVKKLIAELEPKNFDGDGRIFEFSVELSILATTLNRLERSILNWDLQLSSSISHTPKDYIKEDKGYLKLLLLVFIARDISPKDKEDTAYRAWTSQEVIVNGDSHVAVASASAGTEVLTPLKTAEQRLVRKNELKAKSTMLLAIPDEHLLKFHAFKDEKSLWEAIKNRFGGNKESQKMQKTILKQQYENFAASRSEGLDKTYDRFQKLISQLEIHGEEISQEDANLKLLRTSMSSDNSSSTNETVNTAHSVSAASSKDQASTASYADDVMFSFFVAMLTMRVKRFIKKTGRNLNFNGKETIGFNKTKVECYNYYRRGHFARECRAPRSQGNRNGDNARRTIPVETSVNSLVFQDRISGYDWSFQDEEGPTNFALMAYTSQSLLSSDSKREALNKSSLEIIGYKIGLESLEDRIVVHEKNEVVYEENIAFLKYDVQVKDISIKDLKNQLEEALKEKDDLKLKLKNFEESSKNLTKLINSQISANDKIRHGYGNQLNESDLNINENEVVHAMFNSRDSDVDDNPVNDRFKTVKGFHAVPPPIIENFMPPRPDLSFDGLDETAFMYVVRKTTTSVPKTKSNTSKTSKDVPEKPKTVRSSAPLIEEWELDSDNDTVLTKSGQVPVNTTKQSSHRAAVSVSTATHINTADPKPKVNDAIPTKYSYFKAYSPVRRPFNQKSAAKTDKKVNTARFNNVTTVGPKAVVNAAKGKRDNAVNGCSRHKTGNKFYLFDYQDIDGGFVAFRGSAKGGKITSKGKIRTWKLDFEDVYFVKELKFNLFFVLQMCDKKHSVLFTETECLVLSPDFKLLDESQDETPGILKNFITGIEKQIDHKVKTIRCDNGTEFKNRIMNEFCEMKGRKSSLSFMRPFGCPVTILNTIDHLGNQTNGNAGTKKNIDAGQAEMNTVPGPQYVLLPFLTFDSQNPMSSEEEVADDAGKKNGVEGPAKEGDMNGPGEATNTNNTNKLNTISSPVNVDKDANSTYRIFTHVNAVGSSYENLGGSTPVNAATPSNDDYPTDHLMPDLEDTADPQNTGIFGNPYDDEDVGVEADLNNLETTIKTKKVIQALADPSWVEAMQEELLQFRFQKVWRLVDLPKGKHAIGTKWVYRKKKDERWIVVRNKARLLTQGYTKKKELTMMRFLLLLLELKQLEEEVYVCQPLGFEDPQFPNKVYKVDKALYGLHQAPRAWYETLSTYLLENGFRIGIIDKTLFIKKEKGDILLVQMSSMGELTFFLGLQVKQKNDGIFISQDKYVADILKKFNFSSVKIASTPLETNKALTKDKEAEDVDVHLYRSMIGSLMYLTASKPDIMIIRYLKGQPKLGLWYPKDSSFDLEAFSDSNYAGANLDRKSTIRGCQFLSKTLISWQCKKHTIVANSTTEAEYIAAANCCGQVLWIQNQMLDYGFNFMNTKIYIDNESTIYIVKNPVFHSKTKHIEIRHHFIIDSYEKKLIQVIKIHTDHNVADLLTKAFDVSSPTIYASYIEQFWNTVTSKIVNSVKQIHAIVDDKAVVISESSVRSDLLFHDEDGITCLTNDEIFENLALMGYEQLSIKLTFQKEPQTKPLQIEIPPTVSLEPQTEAHVEQILPSPSTYQRKRKKTQKHRRTTEDTELPQTSISLDHGVDEAVNKEGVTVWKGLLLLMLA
ncbi:putative ribonuclease H-like domain-containing protein [Tanacetum coccineum]|uniref:Ribonuclease H-like domain-containing protein n=1 Tax=Tanacetum coccineum TaxID=301880 RepID=A0ABQ5AKS5_9ASTR